MQNRSKSMEKCQCSNASDKCVSMKYLYDQLSTQEMSEQHPRMCHEMVEAEGTSLDETTKPHCCFGGVLLQNRSKLKENMQMTVSQVKNPYIRSPSQKLHTPQQTERALTNSNASCSSRPAPVAEVQQPYNVRVLAASPHSENCWPVIVMDVRSESDVSAAMGGISELWKENVDSLSVWCTKPSDIAKSLLRGLLCPKPASCSGCPRVRKSVL